MSWTNKAPGSFTVKQHYVPEMYLKRFTEDGSTLECYNINDKIQYNKDVFKKKSIGAVCFEKNQYELPVEDADASISDEGYLYRNINEDGFSKIETTFDEVLTVIGESAPSIRMPSRLR